VQENGRRELGVPLKTLPGVCIRYVIDSGTTTEARVMRMAAGPKRSRAGEEAGKGGGRDTCLVTRGETSREVQNKKNRQKSYMGNNGREKLCARGAGVPYR